jgi:hypothetical protein
MAANHVAVILLEQLVEVHFAMLSQVCVTVRLMLKVRHVEYARMNIMVLMVTA